MDDTYICTCNSARIETCPLDGGRFATSDLNDQYRRVINRNNRLKIIDLKAPLRELQETKKERSEFCRYYFDNGREELLPVQVKTTPNFWQKYHEKQGRFRQNLLGKSRLSKDQ